jgi:hypothetical protein
LRAQTALSPQHTKTQGPFGAVIGRFNALVIEKGPQVVHFPNDLPGQFAGIGLYRFPKGRR